MAQWWHFEKKKIKLFIVYIIGLLGKMSMLFSTPTDKIWDCFALQWGHQQYLRRLPEADQRGINHTEAGRDLYQWNWIPSKCKCSWELNTFTAVNVVLLQKTVPVLPISLLPIRNSHFLKHRTVVLRRQATGGLGLSIKVSRYVYITQWWKWKWNIFEWKWLKLVIFLCRKWVWKESYSIIQQFFFGIFREVQSTTFQWLFLRSLRIKLVSKVCNCLTFVLALESFFTWPQKSDKWEESVTLILGNASIGKTSDGNNLMSIGELPEYINNNGIFEIPAPFKSFVFPTHCSSSYC